MLPCGPLSVTRSMVNVWFAGMLQPSVQVRYSVLPPSHMTRRWIHELVVMPGAGAWAVIAFTVTAQSQPAQSW